ncbi:MAG: hypothetical protein OER04_09775 [Cyclobacteriaceae bacterium]|nr:hypothetical protein [Cyclobacteriaceae bacterium]
MNRTTVWSRSGVVLCLFWLWATPTLQAQSTLEKDLQLEIELENRFFFKEGLHPGQERNYLSLGIQPELGLEWKNGDRRIQVSLFFRWDQQDNRRTHFDIRELYYQQVNDKWEWSIGFKKIFWGVTESAHLVDIINQTDQPEGFDGEQKLGQPMFQASLLTNKGTFDFFYLPYTPRRQFPGSAGRFRFPQEIERNDVSVDSDLKSWYPSFALRWSHYFGPVDVGVSNFYGVGREPLFKVDNQQVTAVYPIINQTGVDLQLTSGPMLWKFEGIYRYADFQDFTAMAVGLEYTFSNVAASGLDIGLLGEYLFDSRDDQALSNLNNDVFLGVRLAFNDTQSSELLAGTAIDLDGKGIFISAEGSRRIGDNWKMSLESRIFSGIEEDQLAFFFREDSFLLLKLSKFF